MYVFMLAHFLTVEIVVIMIIIVHAAPKQSLQCSRLTTNQLLFGLPN